MKVNATVSKILSNKWVLNIISILALFNVIGYMVMGNLNNVVFFIILAMLVRSFSKNMIIVLGVPLILVNLISLKNGYTIEGFTDPNDSKKPTVSKGSKETNETTVSKDTNDSKVSNGVESSNKKTDENFEVGRPKNGASKIDYAATIEGAYDQLNSILGSDGIKSLTGDTQRLMQQQADLAKSMESFEPLIKSLGPMADQMQTMMGKFDKDGQGMSGLLDMAKKMSGSLGAVKPAA